MTGKYVEEMCGACFERMLVETTSRYLLFYKLKRAVFCVMINKSDSKKLNLTIKEYEICSWELQKYARKFDFLIQYALCSHISNISNMKAEKRNNLELK